MSDTHYMLRRNPVARGGPAIVLAGVLALASLGCGAGSARQPAGVDKPTTKLSIQKGKPMSDDVFKQVKVETLEESPASPQVDFDTFAGIQIALPAVLNVGETGPVPLCGTWVLPESVTWTHDNLEDSLVFLIRNVETHESFTGHFRQHEDPATLPPEEMPPKVPPKKEPDEPEMKLMGWFNFDLLRVWQMPPRPGRYRIQVVLDQYQSNMAEFEVKGE